MTILPTGFGKLVIFELFTLVKIQEDELTSLVRAYLEDGIRPK